jgi:hypothetical protein
MPVLQFFIGYSPRRPIESCMPAALLTKPYDYLSLQNEAMIRDREDAQCGMITL